ncbi:MAG: ornithine carbamoyltransferase, partial [Eubacterium sp.]|nr:ornithine carbamoyltransferase [Eubacterium sp.]
MKNMLNFSNFTAEELIEILEIAQDMKKNPDKYADSLKGKKLYSLFEKTSTRTFLSFATGITELGGTYFNQLWEDSNFVLGEPVSEIKYVCRNVDIIMARLVKNETVELFGNNVTVPFINGCDSTYHPCQILADALTMIEKFGSLDVKLMYIGAKNNVFNSLVEFFAKMKKGTLYGLTPLVNNTACGVDFYTDAAASGHYIELNP